MSISLVTLQKSIAKLEQSIEEYHHHPELSVIADGIIKRCRETYFILLNLFVFYLHALEISIDPEIEEDPSLLLRKVILYGWTSKTLEEWKIFQQKYCFPTISYRTEKENRELLKNTLSFLEEAKFIEKKFRTKLENIIA